MNFARPSDDKFAGIKWSEGHDGIPVLDEAMAVLECTIEEQIIAGDHEIFIGRVVGFSQNDGDPLLFHKGKLACLGSEL